MKTAFIAGGGTGGHFYPASAMVDFLKDKGYYVIYLGTTRGIEAKKPINADEKILLNIEGVRGKGVKGKLRASSKLLKEIFSVKKLIKEKNPEFSLCFGGYTSIPLGFASFLTKTTLFIHEQNSVPSYSNLVLSKFSKKQFITFDFSKKYFKRPVLAGLPLRKSLKNRLNLTKEAARNLLNLPKDKKTVLIFGGSQGAKSLGEAALKLAELFKDYTFILITGKHFKATTKDNLIVFEYFDDMGLLYKAADLVISRAGASSVNEILAFGKNAIFVPFPYAASNHQYYNVKWLEDKGLATVLLESQLEKLPQILNEKLKNPIPKEKIAAFAILNAEEKMYKEILDELHH